MQSETMKQEEIEALAREIARGVKTEADLVGPLQFAILALQFLKPLTIARSRAVATTLIALGLAHSFP